MPGEDDRKIGTKVRSKMQELETIHRRKTK